MGTVDEELTCSACRDVFGHAHPLPCGHALCPDCVREAWGWGEEGGDDGGGGAVRGRFSCPQCQEEQPEVPCDCCPPVAGEGTAAAAAAAAAVKTCLRCEVSLCAEHLRPHLERPAFGAHPLVEPLGDPLSRRRCPAHREMFRYYCADERTYVCPDCVLEGGHAHHRVKGLRAVEEELKIILQNLHQQAEEKLKEGERILAEQQVTDRTVTDSAAAGDAQVERLGVALRGQVDRLVQALRDSARAERQQAAERLQEDCSRVRGDLSQTQALRRYLGSLLEENDPFLLIWAFQSDDSKLLAELSCPLFTPDPPSLDRKHILRDIESKYKEFITETLFCLSDLKRELLTSPLTLDADSAHPLLSVSDDLRSVSRVGARLPLAARPERFDHWTQVLTLQTFSSGTHYWELEAEGFWDIAVTYRSIGRKGKHGNAFGNNKVSWSLTQQRDRKLAAWHDRRKTRLPGRMRGNRVAVVLDYGAGVVTFSEVGPAPSALTHLHTFGACSFAEPVCLGFGLYKADMHSRISLVTV